MPSQEVALAKLSRPRLHDVLARTRLFTVIDQAARRPVVWLCAQPGAGKTTLVASYLQARKRPGIWYQVDGDDADPASFVYHLRLAERALPARKSAAALPLLTPEYLPDLAGFGRRFFRALFARLGPDATLVFDNFQEAPEGSAFHRLLLEGLAQVPAAGNVLVLSRGEPPPAYAALLAADAIALVDGDALRLTLEETAAIAGKRGVAGPEAATLLQERSQGWAAGLTLLLARAQQQGSVPAGDDADALQHVFGYFAQRLFDGAAAEQRRALMQLALLPSMTVETAEQLTGNADVGRLLERFYRQHLFTDRRRIAGPQAGQAFQFHALFRSFLLHQARAAFSAGELRALAARAAAVLEAAGQWEPALALLAEAQDWEGYRRLMIAHAESLVEQGRRQTVVDWLARLPPAERERDPWLAYWQGRALLHAAPDAALQLLRAGYEQFEAAGNAAGRLACGGAIVQALWTARLGWSEITPWVDRLEALIDEPVQLPTPAMELMTVSALHAAIVFCRLAQPDIAAMARRLLRLIDDPQVDWNQRLASATHLIVYFHNAADHEHAMQLMAKVDPLVESLPASAMHRAFWYVFRAMPEIRQTRFDEAAALFQRAEDLAHAEGLAHAEFAALQFHCYLDAVRRQFDAAQARVARMERHPARGNPDAEMNLWVVQTLLAQGRGDAQGALAFAQRALQAVRKVEAAYFQAAFPPLLASAFVDAGRFDTALELVAQARALARGSYLEVMETQLLLEEAYVALVRDGPEAARAGLARALALAAADRRHAAYAQRILARKPELLVTALRLRIEVPFVRQALRSWRVLPPPEDIAQWPWPVQVFTLGGFEVRVNDAAIEFGRKAPRKTLALLKAIIARGGSAPEAALLDIFWPGEQGDAAAKSLAAGVHRLRGLLEDADAVVQQGGQLALDRARVWVDAWAFERLLAGPREGSDGAAAAALALYRGAFLVEEEGESWPVAMRERLRSKFIQAIAAHAAQLEAAGGHEEAIAWYLRGLAADDVVEPFYQGLMRCYHRLDRLPEAVSAYRRLRQILSVTLSLAPSPGTERLYQQLRLG